MQLDHENLHAEVLAVYRLASLPRYIATYEKPRKEAVYYPYVLTSSYSLYSALQYVELQSRVRTL